MFQGALFGSTFRAGIFRQASRVYGSGSDRQIPRNAGAFSGLVKNSKIDTHLDSSIFGNLGMKLGLVRVSENASLPCALSFRSFIHSGEPREVEEGRARGPMDYVQGLYQETGNGVNGRPPVYAEAGRTPRPMDYAQGLHQETGNGINGQLPLYAEAGRTLRSMDYVQGLLQEERGNVLNGRTRLYQPQFEEGRTLRPMDHVQGLLHERGNAGNGFSGRSPLYQPQVESNADVVHIKLTRNNSFVTLTDSKGNKKIGVSAAIAAGKGDKPGRYSAEAAAEYVGRRVRQMKIRSVVVKVSGFTFFRRKKDAILAFKDGYTNSRGDMNPIVHIEDSTRKPHNGCRLPKQRRI